MDPKHAGDRRVARRIVVLLAGIVSFVGAPLVVGTARAETAAPAGSTRYTLEEGDRLVHVAKRFGVRVDAILAANGLRDARGLRAGREIAIPPAGWVETGAGKARLEAARRRTTTHRVKQGETLNEISARYGVGVDALLAANGLGHPRELRSGQDLTIPGEGAPEPPPAKASSSAATKAAGRTKAMPAWERRARQLAERVGLGDPSVARALLHGRVEKRWLAAVGGDRPPRTLAFPVAGGTVGRGWGSGTGGYHRALDIPGKVGARVAAAAPGVVAYAGDDLAGYGKTVVVLHPGGLVTVYAHNSELRTVAGEKVKRGTRIALLGSTGISRGPHVHFELLHEGRLCDPLPLIRPVPTTAKGRPVVPARDQAVWPRTGGPPKGLRCGPRLRHPAYVGRPRGVRIPDEEQREILAAMAAEATDAEPDPDLCDGPASEPSADPAVAGDH